MTAKTLSIICIFVCINLKWLKEVWAVLLVTDRAVGSRTFRSDSVMVRQYINSPPADLEASRNIDEQ